MPRCARSWARIFVTSSPLKTIFPWVIAWLETHDRSGRECYLPRPVRAQEYIGISFTDMEIDVVKDFLVSDIHVKVFDIHTWTIDKGRVTTALNASGGVHWNPLVPKPGYGHP